MYVSQYQTSDVVDASGLVTHVTIIGRLVPLTSVDYMKLVRLAHDFRRAVQVATRMIARGVGVNDVLRGLRSMLNKAYGVSAYRVAKAIVEGCRFHNCDPRRIEVMKLFIVSVGEASKLGNRNVRLESTDTVRIKYPYDGSWLTFRACFGEEYLPLVRELVELARQRKISYGARVVFRGGKVYLHLSILTWLYLRHFSRGVARGSLIAGFDLNSDRVNMVIIDGLGRIRDMRTEWFPEVTSHGYPGSKARARRLESLARLLRYAYHHGVGTVVFENLLVIKRRKYTGSRTANRKITRFAKRELLQHGVIMAMKYGFKVLLVDPRGTTNSREHDEVMRRYGLDRHMASAYLIATKALKQQ